MFGNQSPFTVNQRQQGDIALSRTFMANVFSWMFIALSISGFFAWYFSTNMNFISLLYNETGMTTLGWVITFAPLAFVLIMSLGFQRLSAPILTVLFVAYAFVMGMSLSFIFLMYTSSSIFLTFLVSGGTFGVMALLGYTTKTDLTKFGSIMFMGLIGIIIASVANYFMKSDMLQYIISVIGVLVFTGLTAYDVQKLKRIGAGVEHGTAAASKLVIMGALTLYLDFINLFLFLLRFLGDRR